ncbi:hypothetical protein RRG08_004510 [Elysia crispata]|uniref:G-protein coupled receptors family 1 profile domain-containing protein n=1 Tax=Elysia crispata TaxID=231223 RepID=A0AAE1B9V3_9GAST|nr:hypothetical protein RRG08_004510 [Elysia crispata]
MNLSASLASSREKAVEDAQRRDVAMVTFMASLSIIGLLVNSLLLDVYLHTRRKVLSTYFITAVAAIDLIVSAVAMPLRILPVVTNVPVEVCALCLSVSYGCIGVSIMLFFCITFDRYQSVCLLQRPLITTQNLHFAGSWAFVSVVYAGIVAPLYLKGEITVLDEYRSNSNSNGETFREVTFLMRPDYSCYSTSLLSHPRRVWDARYIVQFIFAVCCGSLVVLVLALYVLMFIKLRQKDHFRLQSLSLRGQNEAPRELTARPCCDVDNFPAMTKNLQQPLSSDKDYSHSATGELSLDSEEITPSPKSDLEHLAGQKNKRRSSRQDNDTSHSAFLLKTIPNNKTARKTEDCHRGIHFTSLARSMSSVQMIDLKKFRRRIRHKVQPLQHPERDQPSESMSSPEQPLSNVVNGFAAKWAKEQSEKSPSKFSQIKIRNCYLSATLSFFGDSNHKCDLNTISSGNFRAEFTSDTDSICSEPETSRTTLNVNRQEDRSLNKNGNFIEKTPKTIEIFERQRSLSCSSAGDTTKCRKDRRLTLIKDCKKHEDNVETNDKDPDKTLFEQQNASTNKKLAIKSRATAEQSSESFLTHHGFQKPTHSKRAIKENSLSESFETRNIRIEEQAKIESKISQNIGINVNGTSAFPILTISVQSEFYEGLKSSNEQGVNSSAKNNLSRKEEHDEIQPLKTIFTEAMKGANVDHCISFQGKRNTRALRGPRQDPRQSCCSHFEFNLSTRVTARVGLLTLAYCMWWMPFYLTELGIVDYGTLMPEIFFMANVMNPLLHLMTSQIFRYQVRARLRVYMAKLAGLWSPNSSKA